MKEKGITLIALVITIIILLILASVTIATLTGDNGLITKAMEAREKTEIGAIEEQLRLAQMSAKLKKQGGNITIEDLIEELEKQGVDFELEEDGTLIIGGDYIYEFEEKEGEVAWENNGTMMTPKPKVVSIEILDKTESTIKIKVTVKRNAGGTLIYSIQEENGTYQEVTRRQTPSGEQAQEEYTFIIDQNKIYSKIKVEAIAENKQIASKEIDVVSIPALTRNDVIFTYTDKTTGKTLKESDYTKGPVMVQIATKNVDTTGYTLQYTTGDPAVGSNWKNYTTGIEFTNNGNLYVRLGDGRQGGKYATGSVGNIDKLAPNTFTPTATSTTNSITLTGSTTDASVTSESGSSGIKAYYFSKDGGVTWEPTNGQTNTSYAFSGLTQNKSYSLKMKAVDQAGNEIITDTITQATGEVPGLTEASIKLTPDKTTPTNGKVIVTIEKTGGEEYTVQYTTEEVPNSETEWNDYEEGKGITFEENGVIHARLWDGTNAGNYVTANITNIDKTEPNSATITINKTDGIKAEITQSDNSNGSGVEITKCKWIATTSNTEIGIDETKYTGGSFTTSPQMIRLGSQYEGTYYLHVLSVDKAGNKKETISDEIDIQKITNEADISGFNKSNTYYVAWDLTSSPYTIDDTTLISGPAPGNWYDYTVGQNQWANIKTTGGGNDCYWVWIPRYAYKVPTRSSTAETIEIKFLNEKTNIPIGETEAITNTTPTPGEWVVHPAFTNVGNGGFGELTGIWVAKFEASSNSPSVVENPTVEQLAIDGGSEIDTDLKVRVRPNVTSWRNITVGNIFTVCRNLTTSGNSLEGASTIDSHMMKNTEWGSVAYLSRSVYGKNSAIWNNPYYNNLTNASPITGLAGNSQDATQTTLDNTHRYNEIEGGNASTTGNVYGVYDMVGSTWECVAGILSNNKSNSTYYDFSSINPKYYDSYDSYDNKKYGDAVYETSTNPSGRTSWDSDYSNFFPSRASVLKRGAPSIDGNAVGIFAFAYSLGAGEVYESFRPCLVSQQ